MDALIAGRLNVDCFSKRKDRPATGRPFLLGRIVPYGGLATVRNLLMPESYERVGGVSRNFSKLNACVFNNLRCAVIFRAG